MSVRLEDTSDGKYRLLLRMPGVRVESAPLRESQLQRNKQEFVEMLGEVYRACRTKDVAISDPQAVLQSIDSIRKLSLPLVYEFFPGGQYRHVLRALGAIVVEGLDRLVQDDLPLGIIEYEASVEQFIPLDYFYLPLRFAVAKPQPSGRAGLILSLCQLLGFGFVIQRNLPNFRPSKTKVPFNSRLAVDIHADARLRYSRAEVDFFKRDNSDHFDAKDHWPAESPNPGTEQFVTELIARSHVPLNHYCCHCVSDSSNSRKNYVEFGMPPPGGRQVRMEVAEMMAAYLDLDSATEHDAPTCDNAFTFLNACGGAMVTPFQPASFPSLFLGCFGHRGFIGPEHKVPDAFAFQFARVFYANWLRLGHLGLALFKTRWFFVKKYNNPLGLFYTLYADADLQLSRTVDSVNVYGLP